MSTTHTHRVIAKQPAAFVNEHNKRQKFAVIYKDEGGKHTCHYSLRLSLVPSNRKVSIVAFTKCTKPGCSYHRSITSSPSFAGKSLFQVVSCNRAGYCGPLFPSKTHVKEWAKKRDVWSFQASNDSCIDVECKFLKVSCKVSCPSCSGMTQFVVAVATDSGIIEETLPVFVKSKRKIPASMRNKSQREINAYKAKSRQEKRCLLTETKSTPIKRKLALTSFTMNTPNKKSKVDVARLTPKQRAFYNLTDKEKIAALDQKDLRIQQLERRIAYLQSELSTLAQQGVYKDKPANFSSVKNLAPLLGLDEQQESDIFGFSHPSPLTMEEATVPEPISVFLADFGREPMPEFTDIDLENWDLP